MVFISNRNHITIKIAKMNQPTSTSNCHQHKTQTQWQSLTQHKKLRMIKKIRKIHLKIWLSITDVMMAKANKLRICRIMVCMGLFRRRTGIH